MRPQRLGDDVPGDDRRQGRQRRQGRAKIVRRQAELAGMGRQAMLVTRRMLDRVRPCQQLGKEEHGDEGEVA